MTVIAFTNGSRVRLDCEMAIRRLAKSRQMVFALQSTEHRCELSEWKLQKASRASANILHAVSELDEALNMLDEDILIALPQPPQLSVQSESPLLENEPPGLLERAQNAVSMGAEYLVDKASQPVASTASAAAEGVKKSAVATYDYAKPKVLVAWQYLSSPSGLCTVGATGCSFASLQLATLATGCSTASVSATGLSVVLRTSAEVIQVTGSSGAIRKAIRDPQYAKDLQLLLNKRRATKQRSRMLDTLSVWGSMANDGAVARVSPMASNLIGGIGSRLKRMVSSRVAPPDECDDKVNDVQVGKSSYLTESTRLALFVNSWVSTSLHSKVHALKETPENSVEFLVNVAGRAAEYRELGYYDGSLAAYRDLIRPAAGEAASMGLSLGKQACGGAWYCARHPFATLSSVSSVLRPAGVT